MTTSGTVGQTTLDVAKIIEKSYRRCGIPTGSITPELIDIARDNLFLLFNNFSNRGINLWCVDQPILGTRTSKAKYDMPVGTIDVLNAQHRQPQMVDVSETNTTAFQKDMDFGAAQQIALFAIHPHTNANGVVAYLQYSTDNLSWYTAWGTSAVSYTINEHYWYAIDPSATARYWRLTIPAPFTVNDFTVSMCSGWTDLIMQRLNRDDYMALPNKRPEADKSLQYFFDRQISPTMTLWPVPNNELNCLALVTHRQIQDVGAMTNTIEVPDRWQDAFSWGLAAMNAVEVPTVPQDRIQLCQTQASQSLVNAEGEERDSAPIFLQAGIGVYTK